MQLSMGRFGTRTVGCFKGFGGQMLIYKTGEHRNLGQHLGVGGVPGRKQQYMVGSQACVYTQFRRGQTANMSIDPPPLS